MKNRNSADFAGCLVTALLLLWFAAMWILCKSADWIMKGRMKMKNFIVKVEIDGIVTNRLVKAETAEEAERKAKEEEK
ncbi:hypothetical protein [Ligilactobacillus ruminis]|uniref:hypothetical protein n=1 Tax=Ligilactobacillus ruminis TaxID=1623 RepID=UPI0022E2D75E|nr:hypothetical protein [Ligilactobacillus ruminis]